MMIQNSNSTHTSATPKIFPWFRHALPLLPVALASSGLGLIAATLIVGRVAYLVSGFCNLHHTLPAAPPSTSTAFSGDLPSSPTAVSTTPAVPPAQAAEDMRLAHEAGGHTGKLEIILAWGDKNDLDLHVTTPNEGQIYYNHRSADGGRLDIDANQGATQEMLTGNSNINLLLNSVKSFWGGQQKSNTSLRGDGQPEEGLTSHPVEHATWEDTPPSGHYYVQVDPYAMPFSNTSPYRVSVIYNGQLLTSKNGIARADHTIAKAPVETSTLEFDIP